MMISLIAVIDNKKALGYQNKLLVNLPEDLAHFKKITSGHPVIMGQNTFLSIGKALPNRLNIILSKDLNFKAKDCEVFNDLERALEFAKSQDDDEIFFIGGASIYKQAIEIVDKLYLTIIDAEYQVDTWFPDYEQDFKIIREEKHQTKENLNYKFLELMRK
ncbi:dihydrofolate reductase [Candidatus Nomurabacteria bacterium]|nr:dihydrofolate reductase [Candidatus Nomurabacteria bacterium]